MPSRGRRIPGVVWVLILAIVVFVGYRFIAPAMANWGKKSPTEDIASATSDTPSQTGTPDLLAQDNNDFFENTTVGGDGLLWAPERNMYRLRMVWQLPKEVNWNGYAAAKQSWELRAARAEKLGKEPPDEPTMPKAPYKVYMADLSSGRDIEGELVQEPDLSDSSGIGIYVYDFWVTPRQNDERVNFRIVSAKEIVNGRLKADQGYLFIPTTDHSWADNDNGLLLHLPPDGQGGKGEILKVDANDHAKITYLKAHPEERGKASTNGALAQAIPAGR